MKAEDDGSQKKIVEEMVHIISPRDKALVSYPADSAVQAVKDPFRNYEERRQKKEGIGLLTQVVGYKYAYGT